MMYLGLAMRLAIMLIGLYMMYKFPVMGNPPFISGSALVLIGLYLQIFENYQKDFEAKAAKKSKAKKVKKDKKKKKDKYEGNY